MTPGTRNAVRPSFEEITRTKPEKSLISPKANHAGRNNRGKITTRSRGGGSRRMYRMVDFKRRKDGVPGKIASIEYDPNRTTRIALVHYVDGEKSYILAPVGLSTGDMVESGPQAEIQPGNCLPLQNIPTGTVVHNIELTPNRGGQIDLSKFPESKPATASFFIDDEENLWSFLKKDLRSIDVIESSTMPSYADTLTASEVDDLVAYLFTRRK